MFRRINALPLSYSEYGSPNQLSSRVGNYVLQIEAPNAGPWGPEGKALLRLYFLDSEDGQFTNEQQTYVKGVAAQLAHQQVPALMFIHNPIPEYAEFDQQLSAKLQLRQGHQGEPVRDAQQEYMGLEKKLRQTLHDLDVRERSLTKAEEALQHKLTVQKQEMDIVSRKSKSETQHAMSLVEQQKQSSDLIRQQMEDRAVRAELQLKQLQGDLAALRVEQRKSPESVLRQDIIQYQATIATLEKQMRVLQLEKDKEVQVQKELGVQVDRLTQLLHQEKRHQDELKVQEVEALRLKYIAREERYSKKYIYPVNISNKLTGRFVLDGDRQELKAIKKQLDVLRQVQFSQNKELARLQKEKAELLATGQYTEDSFVIQELSRLIAAKQP
ncbi:hypothetical protein DYB31_005030 [Aphanomyces astaci]|uniref:Uncharacterized protein n=1 Tax=Aphanomyces astaci TaxID=112090 RepID=A0A397EIK3_APHAT|nr:hypothetical protein DYB31_005030 [Aphanomyces astaci]